MEEPPSFIDETTCCLCSSVDSDQLLFPCGHTQCRQCINSSYQTPDAANAAVCPLCQVPSYLPIEATGSIAELSGNESCSVCNLKGEYSPCYYKCLDCFDLLCSICSQGHSASSSTVSHRIVPLTDATLDASGTEVVVPRQTSCEKHSGQTLSCYCKSCKQPMCTQCALFDHTDCDRCTMKEASAMARESIHSIIKDRTTRLDQLERERGKALDAIKRMEMSESDVMERLNRESDSIIQKVVAERMAVSQTVSSMFAGPKKQLAVASEIMHTCINLARGTLITCTNALSADDTDLVMLCNNLEDGLSGVHETEESMFHMCKSHQVPAVQLNVQTPQWPMFTLQTANSNSSDATGETPEAIPSANHVMSRNNNTTTNNSANTDHVNRDLCKNETPEGLKTINNTQRREACSVPIANHQRESCENISELKSISTDFRSQMNLDDVCDGPAEVVNNIPVPVENTNNVQQPEVIHSENTRTKEGASTGHSKKKIYVPKAFYNPSKPTNLNANIPRCDNPSNTDDKGIAQLSMTFCDEVRTSPHITTDDVEGRLYSNDAASPAVLNNEIEDEASIWALPQAEHNTGMTLNTPDFCVPVPSTYSDAVKKKNRPLPKMNRSAQVALSLQYSFDTAVKRDSNEVFINGLCFYEDDRILVSDKGNGKLKNLLRDGKQPHNRQFDDNVVPGRIAAIRNCIACISKHHLYIITKELTVISKPVLCKQPPDPKAPLCLTTLKDKFVVGNLPDNKFKAFNPTSGNLTSMWDCPVQPPVGAIFGTAKGQLLICSWNGRGSIHLVDVSGTEHQKFLHSSADRWKPNDVCSDARAFVFAADYARNEIDVFSPQGEMVLAHSTTSCGPPRPRRLIVDNDYKLYVSGDGSRVVVYSISLL